MVMSRQRVTCVMLAAISGPVGFISKSPRVLGGTKIRIRREQYENKGVLFDVCSTVRRGGDLLGRGRRTDRHLETERGQVQDRRRGTKKYDCSLRSSGRQRESNGGRGRRGRQT